MRRAFTSRSALTGLRPSFVASRAVLATGAVGATMMSSFGASAFSSSTTSNTGQRPAVPPTLGALPPTTNEIVSVVLYQYETCPFCNRVRAYLDHARIPYTVVEVDPMFKGQLKWSSYKKVPTAIVNGVQLNDSQNIIDEIDKVLKRKGAAGERLQLRAAGQGSEEEAKWRKWGTDSLVQVLTANIYRSFGEAWTTFDYLTQRDFPLWSVLPSKLLGSAAMTAIAAKRTKQNGWDKLPGQQREALYQCMNALADAVESKGGYIGGTKPCLADVELFGAMRSIAGLPTHQDAINPANTRIGPWYERMSKEIGESRLMHRVGEAPTAPSSS